MGEAIRNSMLRQGMLIPDEFNEHINILVAQGPLRFSVLESNGYLGTEPSTTSQPGTAASCFNSRASSRSTGRGYLTDWWSFSTRSDK